MTKNSCANEIDEIDRSSVFSTSLCNVVFCQFAVTHRQNVRRVHQRMMHSARLKSSHFHSPFKISFLLSLHDALPSFLLLPRHVYSLDNPMSYSLSAPNILPRLASSSHVGVRLSTLRLSLQHSSDWLQPPSLLQLLTLMLCRFRSIFLTSCGTTTLMSMATSNSRLLLLVLSLASMSVLQRSASSVLSAGLFSIFPRHPSAQKSVTMVDGFCSTSKLFTSLHTTRKELPPFASPTSIFL